MARTPLTRPWTDEEIAALREMQASGATPLAMALKLRRKCSGVRSKIAKIQASDQEPAPQRSDRPAGKPDKARPSNGRSEAKKAEMSGLER